LKSKIKRIIAKKFVRITSGFGGGGVPEVASQGMYMSKIEICFFTARILQNQKFEI
jgi:carbamate kinase